MERLGLQLKEKQTFKVTGRSLTTSEGMKQSFDEWNPAFFAACACARKHAISGFTNKDHANRCNGWRRAKIMWEGGGNEGMRGEIKVVNEWRNDMMDRSQLMTGRQEGARGVNASSCAMVC